MSTLEQKITIRGISQYRYKSTPILATGISYVDSIHKETNRQPDNYFFWIDNDGLVDPKTGDYLHNLIRPNSHENPYLGLVEYSILHQLDSWSKKENSKISVWFSPELKKEGLYDENKIVLHEIVETPAGQKKLNNIVIIFECNRYECLEIAKQLFPNKTVDITTPEELRCSLINVGSDMTVSEIIKILSPYIPKNEKYQPLKDEDRIYLGSLIAQGVPPSYFAQEMMRLGAIGEYSLVCIGGVNQSYTNMLKDNSLLLGGEKFVKNCGNCGAVIEARISKGYVCKSCSGVYEGC